MIDGFVVCTNAIYNMLQSDRSLHFLRLCFNGNAPAQVAFLSKVQRAQQVYNKHLLASLWLANAGLFQ